MVSGRQPHPPMENEFSNLQLPDPFASLKPKLGIVLGSGLGPVVDQFEILAEVDYSEIAGMPVSKVPGHKGRLLAGRLAEVDLLIAQGRVHLYEGHGPREVTALVRLMAAAGVPRLILTNSAGSLHPDFQPGHWMMIRDHINLTGVSPLTGGAHFLDTGSIYSPDLRFHFRQAASATGIPMHEGVYAGVPGPQYETHAEIKMLQTLGADAVGMSTVLEAIMALALEVEVAGFSCLTNWGAGLGSHPLSHEEVIEAGKAAAVDFGRFLTVFIQHLPPEN